MGSAPICAMCGLVRSCIRAAISAFCPTARRRSASTLSSTCSRLFAGSGSRPRSCRTSDTAAFNPLRADSGSVSQRVERRSSADSTCSALPAVAPGVITRTEVRSAKRFSSALPILASSKAVWRASARGTQFGANSSLDSKSPPASIQRRNDSGSKFGRFSNRSRVTLGERIVCLPASRSTSTSDSRRGRAV